MAAGKRTRTVKNAQRPATASALASVSLGIGLTSAVGSKRSLASDFGNSLQLVRLNLEHL